MKLIRRSEIIDFMRCRKVWDYRWNQKLETRKPDGKLFFGNLFHCFVETYYNNLQAFDPYSLAFAAMMEMFQETDTSRMAQTEIDDLWDLATKVTENYVKQWGHIDQTWQIIATELTFAIPLDGDLYYSGTIDVIFKDAGGKLFFMDHKTASSIERYVSKVEMDTQISCYWWALEQLARGNGMISTDYNEKEGHNWIDITHRLATPIYAQLSEPSGFIYNIILKDYPEPPEPLKKGGLSIAKNQKTTYMVYLQALQDNDLMIRADDGGIAIPDKYQEILDHLAAQETEYGNRFFRRIPVTRSEHQVQTSMNELLATALDIEYVQESERRSSVGCIELFSPIYRNPTHDCSWCNYRALCLAEMDGVNADFVRNTLYTQKETVIDNGKILGD